MMADEALKCFTSLLESVPRWIADLENILKSAIERQDRLLFENQPVDSQLEVKWKLSRSSSLHSKRSHDEKTHHSILEQDEAAPSRPQLAHMTKSDALRLSQRKRKTASALSGGASGSYKYRSRGMVVIYYDGDIQKRLEALVRSIGTSRNSLRKGKTSARVHGLTWSSFEDDDERNASGVPVVEMTKAVGGSPSPLERRSEGMKPERDAFVIVDGLLERAQAMCERAAHQLLRDGDCTPEMTTAKEQFASAQEIGTHELPALRKIADKAAERQRQREEKKEAQAEDGARTLPATNPSDEKLLAADDPFSSSRTLEVDLEPDDSDGDGSSMDGKGVEFAIAGMKMGNRIQMRSPRLAAC